MEDDLHGSESLPELHVSESRGLSPMSRPSTSFFTLGQEIAAALMVSGRVREVGGNDVKNTREDTKPD